MTAKYSAAPHPTFRLIPSKFPPIGLFDTVATAADLPHVLDLVGWTNDRLVKERVARLPEPEWVFGRSNASIVMASFLHVAPGGMRFNSEDLGAWYAAAALNTAVAEVGHHLRREAHATGIDVLERDYRTYQARLTGSLMDIRGLGSTLPEIYDPASHGQSQLFGEAARSAGETGLLYDSIRHRGGTNIVGFRPSAVIDVVQTDHYRLTVDARSTRIEALRLAA